MLFTHLDRRGFPKELSFPIRAFQAWRLAGVERRKWKKAVFVRKIRCAAVD
jgi:hypothetical protein